MGWRSLMGRGSGRSPSLILLAMGYHHCLYFYHDFKMYVFTTDVENDINKHRNHKRRHVFYLVRHSIYALGGSAGGRRLCRTPTSRQVSWHAAMDACWSCWSRGSCQRDFRQQVSHSLAIRCGWGTSLVPGSPGNYSEQTHGRTALRILHDSVRKREKTTRGKDESPQQARPRRPSAFSRSGASRLGPFTFCQHAICSRVHPRAFFGFLLEQPLPLPPLPPPHSLTQPTTSSSFPSTTLPDGGDAVPVGSMLPVCSCSAPHTFPRIRTSVQCHQLSIRLAKDSNEREKKKLVRNPKNFGSLVVL